MRKLCPPDSHFVQAAEGWLELGNPAEASAELEKVSPKLKAHPDVLEVKWDLYRALKEWDAALATACHIVQTDPARPSGWVNRSFSLHELERTDEAFEYLLPAAKMFPKDTVIPYNLACYCCQLGWLIDARKWLRKAVKVGGKEKIKKMASNDPDLAPLRGEISRM